MSDHAKAPKRVRVTRSTPYGALPAPPPQAPPSAGSPDVSSTVSDVYDVQLRRTIARWAVGTVAVVAIPLFALPLVMLLVPALARAEIAGIPVPWLVLGFAIYPLVWLAGRWFVSGAERTERDYAEALPDRPPQT